MDSKRVGLWLALSALLVNGPRFVIIFLKVDSIEVPKPMEAALLTATGIATGLVLTGGGAYIAHALAESKARGMMQWFMMLCWFLLLIFSVVLLAPLMVAAIDDSSLKTVLVSKFSQWLWSITSVLAVEVIAGGAMVAYALHGRVNTATEVPDGTINVMSVLTGALAKRIAHSIEPQPSVPVSSPGVAVTSVASEAKPKQTSEITEKVVSQVVESDEILAHSKETSEQLPTNDNSRKYTKQERHLLLLKELQNVDQEADIQIDVLAEKLRVSQQTIYRDLADLRKNTSTDPISS